MYPPLSPYMQGALQVDDIHTLYFEQSGNPQGRPVVFLHGGPGAGSNPKHRQFFDPAHYRIVVFDQRGCGQSTPLAETRSNTTGLLVRDIETLRCHLGIEKWHVFGGSWGSTLAISYAIAHAERALSLTLRGIFLMTQPEIDWFLHGMRHVFPESWEAFSAHIPADERHDLLGAYTRRFSHADPAVRLSAARAWSSYESSCLALIPQAAPPMTPEEAAAADAHALSIATIEAHYFLNNRFVPDNFLLANVDKIRRIPAVIVQGRYDMVCPMETAYSLHRAWPEAKFIVVPDAGHSSSEPGVMRALVEATDAFRTISL